MGAPCLAREVPTAYAFNNQIALLEFFCCLQEMLRADNGADNGHGGSDLVRDAGVGGSGSGAGASYEGRGEWEDGGIGNGGGRDSEADDGKVKDDIPDVAGGVGGFLPGDEHGIDRGDAMDVGLGFGRDEGDCGNQFVEDNMIPVDPLLAETHYSQYNDFESDESEEEKVDSRILLFFWCCSCLIAVAFPRMRITKLCWCA